MQMPASLSVEEKMMLYPFCTGIEGIVELVRATVGRYAKFVEGAMGAEKLGDQI